MKRLSLIICCLLLTTSVVRAQTDAKVPKEAIDISNQIILSMYQDILDQKDKYPELKAFGENNVFKNKTGIFALIYLYKDTETGEPYKFGITISSTDEKDFPDEDDQFSYGFPKLNLKIAGFIQKHLIRTQYDITPLISKYGILLAEYQQKFMPLRVYIEPVKDVFKVQEDLLLDVVLKNVSKRHMVVKSLGKDSLYCLINHQVWGTNPVEGKTGGQNIILKSGTETRLRLKGEGFQKSQDVEITCFYGMSIDGVNPMGEAHVKIEE